MATNQNRQVQTEICPVCSTCHDLPLCPQPTRSEEKAGGDSQSTHISHTPGPWWVEDRRYGGALQIQAKHRGDGSSYCIASVNLWESPQANARLIAAAPELLALAKKIAGECADCNGRGFTVGDDGVSGRGPDDVEPTREACAECADIRAVIAKAEGRS